jgi:hypothetical protein
LLALSSVAGLQGQKLVVDCLIQSVRLLLAAEAEELAPMLQLRFFRAFFWARLHFQIFLLLSYEFSTFS